MNQWFEWFWLGLRLWLVIRGGFHQLCSLDSRICNYNYTKLYYIKDRLNCFSKNFRTLGTKTKVAIKSYHPILLFHEITKKATLIFPWFISIWITWHANFTIFFRWFESGAWGVMFRTTLPLNLSHNPFPGQISFTIFFTNFAGKPVWKQFSVHNFFH